MPTPTLLITAGTTIFGAALCCSLMGGEGSSTTADRGAVGEARTGVAFPTSSAGQASVLRPASASPQPRIAQVRHTRPMPLISCEEFWVAVQPIFDALPHLDKSDIHKLDYFCPADFNKDDRIDEHDIALFGATWNDEDSPLFNWLDMNNDGLIDDSDAIEFLHQYREGPRNCEELKEQRSVIC